MNTSDTDASQGQHAAEPLALRSNAGLGPLLRNAAAAGRLEFELAQQALPVSDRMNFIGPHLCDAAADEIDRLRTALKLAMWAMRAPLDEWKGECERKALDAVHAVLRPRS